MASRESLNFKLQLGATFWNKLPEFSIYVNDNLIQKGAVDQTGKIVVEFDHELSEGVNSLRIQLTNKEPTDTVIENGEIVKDMLLNIDNITIDGISLDQLLHNSYYILDQEQSFNGQKITRMDSCINLGWNGTYVLEFSSPFYIWLLENL